MQQHTGPAGPAVAYDFRTATSMHLLVSIGAVTGLVGPDHGWTVDTKRFMLNAVTWAAGRNAGPGRRGHLVLHDDQGREVRRVVMSREDGGWYGQQSCTCRQAGTRPPQRCGSTVGR